MMLCRSGGLLSGHGHAQCLPHCPQDQLATAVLWRFSPVSLLIVLILSVSFLKPRRPERVVLAFFPICCHLRVRAYLTPRLWGPLGATFTLCTHGTWGTGHTHPYHQERFICCDLLHVLRLCGFVVAQVRLGYRAQSGLTWSHYPSCCGNGILYACFVCRRQRLKRAANSCYLFCYVSAQNQFALGGYSLHVTWLYNYEKTDDQAIKCMIVPYILHINFMEVAAKFMHK